MPRSLTHNHVFLYNGKPIGKRFETALKAVCKDSGLKYGREVEGGFIFHDLRHGFVTEMRRAGAPRSVTMSMTGHAPKDRNDRYDAVNDQDRLDFIKKLELYRANVDQTVDQAPYENI